MEEGRMREDVLQIINDIRKKRGMKPIESLNRDLNLRDDLGFDSFDLAELTVRIEDETGIDIFENGIINTVGEILDTLKG